MMEKIRTVKNFMWKDAGNLANTVCSSCCTAHTHTESCDFDGQVGLAVF